MKCLLLLFLIGSLEASLRDKAKQIYIGTAATLAELKDATEASLAGKEFNMLTPGNEMKWDATERVRGTKNYTSADYIVKYAKQHSMRIRGHCLVWHSQLPNWVNGLNKNQLQSAMESRIKDIVGHYKGQLYAWDVVNEVFDDSGNLRRSIWFNTFGESYIAEAFKLAHAADPNVKLYINDYSIEYNNAKSTALYNLVKKLKGQGVPIHGVGFQAHFIIGQVPASATFAANLKRFVDLGVEVAITEMDDRIWLPSNDNTLQRQAIDYGNVIKACVSTNKCVGVTVWGMSDKYSWVPSVFQGFGDALPFDKNFKHKPAYTAIEGALK